MIVAASRETGAEENGERKKKPTRESNVMLQQIS